MLAIQVSERSIDDTVELLTEILKGQGFEIEDAGSEHPLTPESRKIRRLIVARHPGGAEVVLNNFYTPESLQVAFHRMESQDREALQEVYRVIVEALQVRGTDFRVVSEAERNGRLRSPEGALGERRP